ncbi:MAG TPA: ABC transporter ATP-binding protein [Chlamydiales bacterium]|jgi:ATP-binding cassette subfamily B protein/subfamily B ATP-binding cassette protein MsbA|nr:ABC transporter ATP-binding protein [Chlamydiales bacterium]
MLKKRYPGLWNLFVGPRCRNAGLFILILIPNAIAALLEGVSFALILAALSVFSGQALPSLGVGLDLLFPSFLKSMDQNKLFLALMILAVFFQAARSVIGGISLYANSLLALRIQEGAQLQIYQKIFDLSYRCVSQYKIGDLVEYTKTPATILNLIFDNANKALVSLFMVLATLAVMLILHVKLTLFTLFLLFLTGGFHKTVIQKIGRSSKVLTHFVVECSKLTLQILQSMRTIHTYNRQEYTFGKIRQVLGEIIRVSKKVFFWNNFIPSINELLGTLFVTATLLSGIWILGDQKENSLPILITFLALTHRLAIRIQTGNAALGLIVTYKGSLLRLEEILTDDGKEFAPNQGKPFPGLSSKISFQDIALHYPASEKPAVYNACFEIPKGKTIALVGSSGAGKSSILDLLLRLYEPTQGKILIDGVNLSEYSTGSWRDRLGVVSQDIAIFNDTIEENIRFGLHKTEEEIFHASRLAGLEEFILALPEKYKTVVGERGFRLSGGQRQRLALARALIRNPEILILDEATSNLDSHSESLIQDALEQLRSQRTVLIVAHRLSTIMNADQIYVLDQGRAIESGTHLSLLAQKGAYARFWELQGTQ